MKIADNIHQIVVSMPDSHLANLNSYLIKGKAGWTMIDTGLFTDQSFDSLKAGLKNLEITFTDITTIIITHVHPDHFGLAGRIKQLSPQTQVVMHRWESELIESRYVHFFDLQQKLGTMLEKHGVPPYDVSTFKSASMPTLEFVRITFPDCTFFGGETISTGIYDLGVIWTPGHSIGHICLYEPENRILFSGDHVLPGITPNVSYHVQSGDNPLGDYLNALHKIKNLPVAQVLPAHQNIFKNLKGRIEEIETHHNKRKNEILTILKQGPLKAYDISAHLHWNIPDSDWDKLQVRQKRIAVMETIAHLESLRWENRVQRSTSDNVISYSLGKGRSSF